ncbi:MAG: DUF3566 domain-containing protein [Microthrixaceae bacterium]
MTIPSADTDQPGPEFGRSGRPLPPSESGADHWAGFAASADATGSTPSMVSASAEPNSGPDTEITAASMMSESEADRSDGVLASASGSSRLGGRKVLGYQRQRYEARKVRRLIRHVDPWSALKLSSLLALCMWVVVMIASAIMWTVATNAGTISSLENFVNSSLSLQDWSLDGSFLFRQLGIVTFLLSIGFVLAMVVATLIFNLVSDIIGGVWISVIEEETARPVTESNR